MSTRKIALFVCILLLGSIGAYGQEKALERFGWKLLTKSMVPKVPIRTANEQRIRFSDLTSGNEIVIVNFWATWCAPCVEELPDLQKLHNALTGKGVRVLLINAEEDPRATQEFLRRTGVTLRSYYDTRGRLGNRFGTRGLPVSFLINKQQEVFARYVGVFPWTDDEFIAVLMSFL